MAETNPAGTLPASAEQRVAAFMAAHGREILEMPLSKISSACGVSDATVVRYCLHAGYKGLKDFKIALAGALTEESKTPTLRGDEPLPLLRQNLLAGCMDALRMTSVQLSAEELGRAISAISRCDNLDVYACGGSQPIAAYLRHQFIKLGIRVNIYSDRTSMMLSQSSLSPRDAVLAISSSGVTRDVCDAQASARAAGVTAICITAAPDSPLAAASDILLVAAGDHFLDNSTYSRLSQLAVVDLLYAGAAGLRKKP